MLLEYTIEAVEEILSLMIIIGMTSAYVGHAYTKTDQKIFRVSILAGIAAAIWMAVMKNATNRIDTSSLNLRLYIITFAAFAAFIVLTIVENILAGKQKSSGRKISAACIALSVYVFMLLFMITPDFLAYPYSLKVSETTVFSSSYILKLSGVIIGFVLTLVAAFASNRMGRRLKKGETLFFLLIMACINQVKQFGSLIGGLFANGVIRNNHTLFRMSVFIQNHDNLFVYLTIAAACAAAVVMLLRSRHVNEPYSNPAQHRKIRAKWRTIRKWAATSLSCAALAVLLMTVINSAVNAEVTMSPTVNATVEGDNAIVDFDDVSDGHLHRFGYTTENGITVRFIVIKKPNASTYGVGMDCCDICGETGYYENKAGDVVCSRCNVIMNINTIGFKGGCNPKVVDYTVEHNQIIIPLEQLTQYEKDFKNGRGTGSVKN